MRGFPILDGAFNRFIASLPPTFVPLLERVHYQADEAPAGPENATLQPLLFTSGHLGVAGDIIRSRVGKGPESRQSYPQSTED